MKTLIFENLPSTNDYAKGITDLYEDLLIVSKSQTKGRGTKGRSFISSKGGAYLSLIRLNPCFSDQCFKIMKNTALAVVYTLKAFGVDAKIKWPNDIFVKGKKICGILIENVFSGDILSKSIIGVGINVNNTISEEIKDIAISMKEVLGKEVDINTVIATFAYNAYMDYDDGEYEKFSCIVGQKISINDGKSIYTATCLGFNEDGSMNLDNGNKVYSGEVSVI